MGRKKRSRSKTILRRIFGASSVTEKNMDRSITAINRTNTAYRKVARREIYRQTEEARRSGNMKAVKRGENVLERTASQHTHNVGRRHYKDTYRKKIRKKPR